MKRVILAVLMFGAVAAGAQKGDTRIHALGDYAVAHRLTFIVFCMEGVSSDPTMNYGAIARQEGDTEAGYVEEGAKPFWVVHGRNQAETVQLLLRAIQGTPNSFPAHRPPPPKDPKRQCKSPVTDKNYKSPCVDCGN